MAKVKRNVQPQNHRFAVVIFKSVLISLLVSLICILVLSLITLVTDDLIIDSYLRYIMVAVTMLSIFIGGVFAGHRLKSGGLLVGMAVGIIYVLISLALGMEMSVESSTLIVAANKCLAGLAAGALGGLVGVNL